MKKSLVALFIVCLAVSVNAKTIELPKQGFGLQIGWAQPTVRLNSPDNPESAKDSLSRTIHLNGFKVGLVYDASYIAGFGSTIGINYTFGMSQGKWTSVNPNFNQYPKSRTLFTYHQIELFVDWQYKFEIAKETYLMLYTGPTLQCGLDFDMRIDTQVEDYLTGEVTQDNGDWNDAYQTSSNDNKISRLNVTWGVGAGFQYKRYFLRGGYDFGLLNPYKNNDFDNGRHTRGRMDQWNIRLGVYLWYND
ncbi:MAG: outer membrane beta-barrel protein [Paludibacteraceae bacterium]|nr:outer membrane beta-barrel protein [Paludibacteraceae bacterium]MBR4705215.1 outer membrane beta-barrel protein [Paludibacteraceae bacterium]